MDPPPMPSSTTSAGPRLGTPAGCREAAARAGRAGTEHRRGDAGQLEVERVVRHDRAGREAPEPEVAIAPRLAAGPPEHLGDVPLRPVAERVEGPVARAGAPDL